MRPRKPPLPLRLSKKKLRLQRLPLRFRLKLPPRAPRNRPRPKDKCLDFARHKRYRAFNDSTLTLAKLRDDGKGGAIARFAEVTDRNAAEKLRGTALTVPRSAMPALAEGEYYHADLIGLRAISTSGEELGECVAVENFGAGDVLEIRRPDGKRFMVPMTQAAVPEWSEERIVVEGAYAE